MSDEYFANLNYTLANEDAAFETAVLPEKVKHVTAVAGSGSRVLPLFSKKPKSLTCLDLSEQQLHLSEMRLAALRELDFEQFEQLLGYRDVAPSVRQAIFSDLDLSSPCRDYMRKVFTKQNWDSILYLGRWERFLLTLSKGVVAISGKKCTGLLECENLEEQKEYLESTFPKKRWKLSLMLLGNSAFFNSVLYKGSFPKKNIPESFFEYYNLVYDRIFNTMLVRDNFYMNLLLAGKLKYPNAHPPEANQDYFDKAKEGAQSCEVTFVKESLVDYLKAGKAHTDFVSLSNVPSYFTGDMEKNFLQMIRKNINPNGLVVSRSYIHVPFQVDTSGYERVTSQYKDLAAQEQMQMYYIDVYRRLKE